MREDLTIIKVDASQAMAAERALEQATEQRIAAVRELAAVQNQQERDRIAALKESESAAQRVVGVLRQERLEARERATEARQHEAAAKSAVRDQVKAERDFAAAVRARNDESARMAATMREQADAGREISSGLLDFGSKVGNVLSGLQALVGLAGQAVAVVDDLAQQSATAKSVGANLSISIDGARAAFKGYIDDVELARLANQAYEMGVVSTGEEFAKLAAGVQAKSEKLGVSSQQLLQSAVTGIARHSTEVLDNLGIILNQAKAEEIYAKALTKTVDQLTAVERQEAFAKAATILLSESTKSAAKSTDGWAESWRRLTVDAKNAKNELLGFDASSAATTEALRGLSEEGLERLRFGEVADDASAAGKELNAMLGRWGVSLDDVRKLADKNKVSYQELIKQQQQALGEREAEAARKAMEATHRELADMLVTRADEIDQAAQITGILDTQGEQQLDILRMQEESLELRLEAAQAVKDEAAALQLTRDLEVNRAQQEAAASAKRRTGRGGGDPNAALKRQLELTLAQADAARQVLEANAELQRDEQDRLAIQAEIVNLAVRELDARQAAAEAMRTRGAAERQERELELMEIATERRLLAISVEVDARARERELAERRIADLQREIEVQDRLGANTKLLAAQLLRDQQAMADAFGTLDEQANARHAIALVQAEQRRAAMLADEQAALEAYQQRAARLEAAGSHERDLASQRIELEAQLAAASGDTDRVRQLHHEAEVHRIRREVEVRQRATQATNQALSQGMQLFSLVSEAAIKDDKKRERAMMRARGIEALARAALETVEAVAAFASFNYVQGALHVAAAAVAGATGAALLAGKIPGNASASASAGATASSGPRETFVSENDRSGAGGRGSPEVPPSAEALIALRQQQQGTTGTTASKGGTLININGPIVTANAGTVLSDLSNNQVQKWGAA